MILSGSDKIKDILVDDEKKQTTFYNPKNKIFSEEKAYDNSNPLYSFYSNDNDEQITKSLIFNPILNEQTLKSLILIISYLGEKLFHLKPSGIDNLTSLNGGIILFKNFQNRIYEKKDFNIIKNLNKIFKFFLIDTKVKRNTSTFINEVSNFKLEFKEVFNNSIESIRNLVIHLNHIFDQSQTNYFSEESNVKKLLKIFDLNQHLLSIIQVSSKEIDHIVNSLKAKNITSKITGAGGGGFVLAAVPIEKLPDFYHVCECQVNISLFKLIKKIKP